MKTVIAFLVFALACAAQTPVINWTVSGLPPGLSFDAAKSEISGTPTKAGTFPVTITATDSASGLSATATMDLVVHPKLVIKSAGLPSVTITEGTYSFKLEVELITQIP